MKSYLITTGLLFALLSVLHVWRLIDEWDHNNGATGFLAGMLGLIILTTALAFWAGLLLRNVK